MLSIWDSNKFDLSGFESGECVHKKKFVKSCLCKLVVLDSNHLDVLKT